MNIYGDWGNTLTLRRRLEWYGYSVTVLEYNPGDVFPDAVDIIVGGGGQDSGQSAIQTDLLAIASKLRQFADAGVPMLMICGMYQLFGHYFKTREGATIQGIGVFDAVTHGDSERMIGNIVTKSDLFGDIIGYENHSGVTTLGTTAEPFGHVIKGAGNNGNDTTEGAIYNHVIGTYLHGSLLPKNPAVADWLIKQAVTRKYGEFNPKEIKIDDSLAQQARAAAVARPR